MFRFKQFLLILENRIDFLKGQQDPELHHIIDHYATHVDPTEGKEYTSKLLSWHKAGVITPKDSQHLNETLSEFHKLKKIKGRLQKTDINQYKNPTELEDAVVGSQGASGKEEDARVKKEEVEHIHSEDGVTITSPKSEAASCLLGKNTKWCTTWTGTNANGEPKNMFHYYNNQGPLYVIDTPSGKYQYHEPSGQFKNAEDEEVSMQKVALKHPQIVTGLRKVGLGQDLVTDRKDLEEKLKGNNYSLKQELIGQHPLVTPEDITKVLNSQHSDLATKEAATEHPTAFTKEHLDSLLASGLTSRGHASENLARHALSRSKAVTEDHVSNIINNPDEAYERKVAVLENPHGAVQSHHVDDVLKNTSPTNEDHIMLRATAMSSTGVEPRHIEQVLNNPDEPDYVKRAALDNKALTSEQAKKVLDGDNERLKDTVITHPTAIGPEDIDKYFSSSKPSGYVIEKLIRSSPAFRPHHIDKIVDEYTNTKRTNPLSSNAMVAIKSRTATPENIDNLLEKPSSNYDTQKLKKIAISESPAARPEHLDKILSGTNSDDDDSLVLNDAIIKAGLARKDVAQPHHIDKILADQTLTDDHLSSVIKSPALTSEHIGRILRDPEIFDHQKTNLLPHPKLLPSHVDYVLNNPEMGHDMKMKALEHPTAVRPRHLDQLFSDPYFRNSLQAHAVYHPTALKPRHIDKMLDRPDEYGNFVLRGAFNRFSQANAILPRHIEKVLHNPDKYDPDIVDLAVNHPVTKQMAANQTPATT